MLLRDQLEKAKVLAEERILEMEHLWHENDLLHRELTVANAKYLEERHHSAKLEKQLSEMLQFANKKSEQNSGKNVQDFDTIATEK